MTNNKDESTNLYHISKEVSDGTDIRKLADGISEQDTRNPKVEAQTLKTEDGPRTRPLEVDQGPTPKQSGKSGAKEADKKNGHTSEQDTYLQIDNLPNRITIFRVALVPVVIGLLTIVKFRPHWLIDEVSLLGWAAGWTFTLASITDFLDGYIARKRNIITAFGSFIDPIADKFLVVSSLIMLGALERIPVLLVITLVLRELYMTSLRLLATTEGITVPVTQLGKWKTAMQMVGIPMLMANEPWQGLSFPLIGKVCVYIAAALSLYSAFDYSFNCVKKIKHSRKLKRTKKG
jgi:CDP-diacylglycerol--glycerol-3-phosphate 3-phosphatidyltransferase